MITGPIIMSHDTPPEDSCSEIVEFWVRTYHQVAFVPLFSSTRPTLLCPVMAHLLGHLVLLALLSLTWATISGTTTSHIKPGILKLIVKAYVDELLQLSDVDKTSLKRKLTHMSDHVATHPALFQRHMYVGHEAPIYDPDQSHSSNVNSMMAVRKRSQEQDITSASAPGAQFPSEEICSTISQWEQINSTNDFNNQPVEVVQEEGLQQYVFTYRCAKTKVGPCTGISPLYQSECTERFGWMYMYYKKSPEEAAQWGYVEAPHHCACKIQPKAGLVYATTPALEDK
ncbi:hypothetical protein HDE_02747 [Halotydeus destructor]|nr:hypothetical protein HDE_02747 [Halotydeus destructor]